MSLYKYTMASTADSRSAGFGAHTWEEVLAFSRSVDSTHKQAVFVFRQASDKIVCLKGDQVLDTWDDILDYEAAYAESMNCCGGSDHRCTIQETPDGMGCVHCLYH